MSIHVSENGGPWMPVDPAVSQPVGIVLGNDDDDFMASSSSISLSQAPTSAPIPNQPAAAGIVSSPDYQAPSAPLMNLEPTKRSRKEKGEKPSKLVPKNKKVAQSQPAAFLMGPPVAPVVSYLGNAGGGLAGYNQSQTRQRSEARPLLDPSDYGLTGATGGPVWDRVKASAHHASQQVRRTQDAARAAPQAPEVPSVEMIDQSSLSTEQRYALDLALRNKSFFFTGPGGTGKSYLMKVMVKHLLAVANLLIQQHSYRGVYVTASTGVAACNIGGVTLHSWAGLGLADAPADKMATAMLRDTRRRKTLQRWQDANVLIIDEVSMLAGDFFTKLDQVARIVRRNPSAAFGGMQVILAGDFLQLPPVKNPQWCFETQTWRELIQETVQLTQVFRQSDAEFVRLLNEVRFGIVSMEARHKFNACMSRKIPTDRAIQPTRLFSHKSAVEQANFQEYNKLTGEEKVYEARDWVHPDHPDMVLLLERDCQAPKQLKLRMGAQVMLLKNIAVEDKLYNGARGVVLGFQEERIVIDGKVQMGHVRLPLVEWTTGRVSLVPSVEFSTESSGKMIASRSQIPLTHAWALSIHKAQGTTLDCAELSLGEAFEYGQVYVALSRARSLEGLYIQSLEYKRIRAHPKALQFYQSLHCTKSALPIGSIIPSSQAALPPLVVNDMGADPEQWLPRPATYLLPAAPVLPSQLPSPTTPLSQLVQSSASALQLSTPSLSVLQKRSQADLGISSFSASRIMAPSFGGVKPIPSILSSRPLSLSSSHTRDAASALPPPSVPLAIPPQPSSLPPPPPLSSSLQQHRSTSLPPNSQMPSASTPRSVSMPSSDVLGTPPPRAEQEVILVEDSPAPTKVSRLGDEAALSDFKNDVVTVADAGSDLLIYAQTAAAPQPTRLNSVVYQMPPSFRQLAEAVTPITPLKHAPHADKLQPMVLAVPKLSPPHAVGGGESVRVLDLTTALSEEELPDVSYSSQVVVLTL